MYGFLFFLQKKPIMCALICLSIILALPMRVVKAEMEHRSTSLKRIEYIDGNTERISYINDKGELAYAADKHFAYIIKTKNGNQQLDEYYNTNDELTRQDIGYYAILREYDKDGNNYKITYLGKDKEPIKTSLGYAISIRSFDEDGRIIQELYYDINGRPTQTKTMGYGCYRKYDQHGNNTIIIYVDKEGKPTKTGRGVAIVKKTYYDSGKDIGRVKTEFYYDEHDAPVSLALGQYGVSRQYDEYGRTNDMTYLDQDGVPIINKEGYSIIKMVYYDDDTVQYEYYYDAQRRPVRLSEGQYGVYRTNGNIIYLDLNGNRLFNLRYFLHESHISVVFFAIISVLLIGIYKKSVVLLPFYVLFIIYMTLLYRTSVETGINMIPFSSYFSMFSNKRIIWEILNNVFLFMPLGAIMYQLYPHIKALLLVIMFSVIIEIIQLFSNAGLCELDDVISNSLGGAIGYLAGKLTNRVKLRINSWKHIHIAKRR